MRNYLPIQVVASYMDENGLHFLDINEQKDISGPIAEKVQLVLKECNGHNTPAQISSLTNLDLDFVSEILAELEAANFICDSRKQYQHFHRVSSYPAQHSWELTQEEISQYTYNMNHLVKVGEVFCSSNQEYGPLEDYLSNRKTCRHFDEKRSLSMDQICGACKAAYYLDEYRSVPSGGGLYPLEIYVVVENSTDLDQGYYQYDPMRNELVLYDRQLDIEQLKHCFNMEDLAYGSGAQIIIAADLERQVLKYGDRGYRLTLIEVGHVAQNIALFCVEKGLGSCEFGGLLDEVTKSELQTFGMPLLAIGIGYESNVKKQNVNLMKYTEEHFSDYEIFAETFDGGDFFGATAKYDGGYAGATAHSYEYAMFKAGMEAYERELSSRPRPWVIASQIDLERDGKICYTPDMLVPLNAEQKAKHGFFEFDERKKIAWNVGRKTLSDDTIQEVYIPSDLVYYGFDAEEKLYNANSSGIAAHFSKSLAEKSAILELIERDAIMRSWFTHQSPMAINEATLPEHAKKRKIFWQSKHRDLIFLNLPSVYGIVIEAIIVSSEYPCFTCGAAATYCEHDNDIDETILKALSEAEYALYSYLTHPEEGCKDVSEIKLPSDHGEYYHQAVNAEKLQWLWSNNETFFFSKHNSFANSFAKLKRDLGIIIVDMSDKRRDDSIHLVRAFSEKLVPISFGYGMLHFLHGEVKNYLSASLELPHYFA